MPEQSEPEQLYVVVEIDTSDFHRIAVTGPLTKARAERFAREEFWSFAGPLAVRPATQADLDDADGEA